MIELNRIHTMPCADMFAQLSEQAALVVADPPYGIGFKSMRKIRKPPMGQNRNIGPARISPHKFEGDNVIDTSWIAPAYASLKTGGAMYLFTRWDVLHHWQKAARKAGFKVVQCLVWDKCHWGMGNLEHYGSMTENILYCIKGAHSLRWHRREGNLFRFAMSTMMTLDGGGRHPTQKPIAMFRKIIEYSSDINDLIVDPFTGSGAACIAAQRLHRRFIGCDISPTFAAAAQAWLEDDARTNSQVRMTPMFPGGES